MSNVFNVARWEWFKLQRRRMPWILLGVLLVFTQLAIWGTYVSLSALGNDGGRVFLPQGDGPRVINCDALQTRAAELPEQTLRALRTQCQQREMRRAIQRRALSPAGAISTTLSVVSTLGLVLAGILSSVAIGSEYGLGTLRPILARGTGRLAYLGGQFTMLYAVIACALVVVAALAGASGVVAGLLAGPAPAGIEIGSDWAGTAASIGKTWVGLVAFVTLTGAIAVLTRSTAAGMAFGLGYYVAEGILVRLLSAIFDWFETIAEYLPIRNINALAGGNSSLLPAGLGGGTTVEPLQAGIVLCGYIVVFGGFAALVFAKRDVVGASGR